MWNENFFKGEFCRSCRFDRCLLGGMNFRTIQKFPNGIDVNKISAMLTEKKRQLFEKDTKSQNYPDFGQYDVTMVIDFYYLGSELILNFDLNYG